MKNEFSQNELDKNAAGGAELMLKRLHKHIRPDLLENVQIINSRYRGFDPDKKHYLLWEHDLPGDPESVKIFTDSDIMNKLEVYVFVSRWQRNQFVDAFPLLRTPQAYQKTTIIHNAIEPFDLSNRKYMTNGKVNLIYTPTPHRGLEILVPVFIQLAKDFPDILHLDVYSSFNLYGWGERDKPYEHLFKAIEDHQDATYHGSAIPPRGKTCAPTGYRPVPSAAEWHPAASCPQGRSRAHSPACTAQHRNPGCSDKF